MFIFRFTGNESDKYGQTRLFGSLGWGLSSFFFGWIIDHYSGNSQEKNYFSAYVAGAIFMFLNILVGLTIQVLQYLLTRVLTTLYNTREFLIF